MASTGQKRKLLQAKSAVALLNSLDSQGDRILIPSIDVDERFVSARIPGPWVVGQGSTLLLLLEI